MKYDAHGLEHYTKAHFHSVRAIRLENIAFFISTGWIIYRSILVNQEYITLIPLAILIAMFIFIQQDTAQATRFTNLGFFSRLGQPPLLSLSDKGFHFEEGPVYKATPIQEVTNTEGHPEYLYVIKKEETSDYYIARSLVKLPFQSFTFAYKDGRYTFTSHNTPIG